MNDYAKEVTILYVEDEDDVREGYARSLKRICKKLYTAEDGITGLQSYKLHSPDIIISDIKMPNMNGLEMVKAIKEINPHANIIFTTAHSESAYLLEAIELQVEGYLLKPVQKKTIIDIVQKLSKNVVLEKENMEQREILQHIIDSDNALCLVTDAEKVSYASHSFLSFFNVSSIKELGEKFSSVLDIVQHSEKLINKENILKSFNKGVSLYDFIHSIDETHRVISLVDGDSVEKSFLVNISKITQTKFLINLTDVTKMQKEKEDTTKKAYTDSLTGIANRNKFEEVFLYELQKTQRYQERFTIALMDIDHFKLVNDNFGHLIGDEILVCITDATQKSLRASDLFARWGGEEFVILFNKTDLENATLSVEHIRKLIQNTQHNLVGEVTVSFGLTEYKDGDTIESMLARADEALYKAKASGRNCVRSVK